ASERKLRLFAVACCRLVLRNVSVSPRAENEVNVAERYADGDASSEELADARCYSNSTAEHACMNTTEREDAVVMADCAAGTAAWAATQHGAKPPDDNSLSPIFNARLAIEQGVQCGLLRDIFDNPFRRVAINPSWLAPKVTALAEGVYDERRFDRCPSSP